VKYGRSADARDLLLSQVPAGILTDTKDIVSTADFAQTVNIGNRLRMIGCPIDAIELYVTAVRHGDATHGDLVGGLSAALRDLDSETFVKFVEDLDTKSRPFSLHLFDSGLDGTSSARSHEMLSCELVFWRHLTASVTNRPERWPH
jgi:hypothetical protein